MFQEIFKGVSRKFKGVLQFCCCLALIAATRAEGGLVFLLVVLIEFQLCQCSQKCSYFFTFRASCSYKSCSYFKKSEFRFSFFSQNLEFSRFCNFAWKNENLDYSILKKITRRTTSKRKKLFQVIASLRYQVTKNEPQIASHR